MQIAADVLHMCNHTQWLSVFLDIVQNIIKDYTHLANTGKAIISCWIPSHVILSDFIPTYSFCSYPPFMALNGL